MKDEMDLPTTEQQLAQCRSLIIDALMIEYPDMTRSEATLIYERVVAGVQCG